MTAGLHDSSTCGHPKEAAAHLGKPREAVALQHLASPVAQPRRQRGGSQQAHHLSHAAGACGPRILRQPKQHAQMRTMYFVLTIIQSISE